MLPLILPNLCVLKGYSFASRLSIQLSHHLNSHKLHTVSLDIVMLFCPLEDQAQVPTEPKKFLLTGGALHFIPHL